MRQLQLRDSRLSAWNRKSTSTPSAFYGKMISAAITKYMPTRTDLSDERLIYLRIAEGSDAVGKGLAITQNDSHSEAL